MFYLLSFFWAVRTTKAILFWIYLWQLKEYHLGRFFDHFRTKKGKQLIFNRILIFKILLFLIFLFGLNFGFEPLPPTENYLNFSLYLFKLLAGLPFLVLILYIFETIHSLVVFFRKKLKKPVITQKTAFLISAALFLEILLIFILFLYIGDKRSGVDFRLIAFSFLSFDILIPLIISGLVLFLQPLTVLLRNRIIEKAKRKREQFKDLLVIGITGSYGKTSTKEFLAEILGKKYNVLKTKEHQNSEIGISQCILNDLKSEHEIFVCEMGAYNRGGIKLLCDIAKPKIGILTGINEQHMATFGSLENIIRTKYELIEFLPEPGIAIFNGDNEHCFNLYQHTLLRDKRFYSLQSNICGLQPDIWASTIAANRDFLSFQTFLKNGESAVFKLNLLGDQNVLNVLAAVCCAKELGMDLEEIIEASKKIEPRQSGIELKKGINDLNVIDAAYSANPDGVVSHLEYLKIWPGKRVIVMPCLIELGRASKEIHKKIGKKIGEICDLAIITTQEYFQEIGEGAMEGGIRKESNEWLLFTDNPKEIFEKITSFCQKGDVILLESRVPRQLIKQLII